MNVCTHIGKDGKNCRARPIKDTSLCYWHSPQMKQSNILASSKGGQNRRLQSAYGDTVELRTPHEVQEFLSNIINAVWTGKIPVQVGTSMGFLAKCWMEAYQKSDKAEDPFGLKRFSTSP